MEELESDCSDDDFDGYVDDDDEELQARMSRDCELGGGLELESDNEEQPGAMEVDEESASSNGEKDNVGDEWSGDRMGASDLGENGDRNGSEMKVRMMMEMEVRTAEMKGRTVMELKTEMKVRMAMEMETEVIAVETKAEVMAVETGVMMMAVTVMVMTFLHSQRTSEWFQI